MRFRIALVGKYVELYDSYKSIIESLTHAGAMNKVKVKITCIHSEMVNEDNVSEKLTRISMEFWWHPGLGTGVLMGKFLL